MFSHANTPSMPQRKVTLVDLQIQNIMSVAHALNLVGAQVIVARDAAGIAEADRGEMIPGDEFFARLRRYG